MGGVVAQQPQGVGILAGDDGHPGIGGDHRRQILHLAVDADRQRRFGEAGSDVAGDIGAGDRMVVSALAAVGQGDGDHGLKNRSIS